MATKIILKKSSTGGSAPLTSDLDQSELAINLADRKIYTKNNSGAIVTLNGAYVDSVAPANPAEGDLWYDTANNLLKAYNGSSFESAGYQTLGALEDVTLTTPATGNYLKYNGSNWVNSNFETDAEALFTAANTGTGHGDLSYANGVYTFDRVTAGEIRGEISLTDAGGMGSMSYNNTTGVITYNGATDEEVQDVVAGQIVSNGTHTNITATYDDVGNGAINLSISDSTIRGKISVVDSGGDGSLSYNAGNGVITYNGPSASETRAHFSASNTGIGYGDLSYADGVYTFDRVTNTEIQSAFSAGTNTTYSTGTFDITDATIRGKVSAVDAGGDGSFSYNSSTGAFTYTGPSAAETRAHFTGGTGVTITNGSIAIGQSVATTADVTFNSVETSLISHPGDIIINPDSDGATSDLGTVTIQGNLTVTGTTTTVNSNEVNIGDSIILLNADETGVPTQNSGIEIERGTAANVSFIWNETDDAWDLSNETLQNVVIDGGSY